MRTGSASTTAAIVSFSRGLATLVPRTREPLHDDIARDLVPAPFAQVLALCAASPLAARVAARATSLVSLGLVDHLALRTLAIDAAVRTAVARGARQLVILGAGLDARAYRLPELAGVDVFEVDHPDTQAGKRERLGSLVPTAKRVRFVAVDFARDDLATRLAETGHDPSQATIWIWEGVTIYLPSEAMRATLDVVARRSAAGSTLATTYTPPAQMRGALVPMSRIIFGVLGEPIVGMIDEAAMRGELTTRGFVMESDEDGVDWRARYGGRWLPFAPFAHERLAVAQKK